PPAARPCGTRGLVRGGAGARADGGAAAPRSRGPVSPPHRPSGDPQVGRTLADRIAAGKPARGLQPQRLPPLLLSGRIPATLRIPHAPVIRPQPPDVTPCALRINPG